MKQISIKMSGLKIFFPILLLGTLGCSTAKKKDCPPYQLENYYLNEELGFSVRLPDDYILNENYGVLDLAAVKAHSDSIYLEAYGITVENNTLNYRLDEFFRTSFENDKIDYIEEYGTVKVLGQGKTIINDYDAYWSLFWYGNERSLNYHFVSKNKTYKIILLSNDNVFDSLACKFESIINTMAFFK
jgi:hypothetical protein